MNGLAGEMNRKICRTRTTAIVINEYSCGSGTTNAIKRRDVTGSLSNPLQGYLSSWSQQQGSSLSADYTFPLDSNRTADRTISQVRVRADWSHGVT